MAVFLSTVDKSVVDELERRVKFNNYLDDPNSDRTYIQWQQRTPWIKLFSNVLTKNMDASQIIKDTTTDAGMANSSNMLASSHVLLGTTLLDGLDETPRAGFEDMYTGLNEQNDTNIPFRPYPVIESAEIKTVGKLGSLRKAIVNFKCFTLEQLQQMEILYMTPGASCVLQWGWSYQNMDPTARAFKLEDVLDSGITPYEVDNINEFKRKFEYNADALVGIITNFEYSMGETGIFNCNIELTARGFEGLFVDKDNSKANIDFADGKGEVEITLNDFSDRFEDYLKLPNIRKCIFRDNWLAIGLIEDKIISKFTQKGGIGIFKSYQFITDSNGNQIKCSEYCGNHDKLLSMDTDKFILPNGTYSYSNLDTDRGPVHIEIPVVSDPEVDKTKTFNANNGENGYIRNILVHKQVIKDALASCTSIMDLMERILSEINKYSLNYFNFKIIADSTTQTSKIIDFDGGSNSVRSLLESQSTLEFKIMERGSIVRNISMGSKLPNKMKTAAMYSINGLSPDTNGSALGRMFNGVSDSYLNYLKSKHATENEQFKPAPSTKIMDTDFIDRALAARDKILNAKNPIVEWHINEKYWGVLRRKLLDVRNENQNNNKLINDRMIPITLDITLDGISGLKYGNAITVDYLMPRYKKNCLFQITYITDTINSKEWTTQCTAQIRVGLNRGKLTYTNNTGYAVLADIEQLNREDSKFISERTTLQEVAIEKY